MCYLVIYIYCIIFRIIMDDAIIMFGFIFFIFGVVLFCMFFMTRLPMLTYKEQVKYICRYIDKFLKDKRGSAIKKEIYYDIEKGKKCTNIVIDGYTLTCCKSNKNETNFFVQTEYRIVLTYPDETWKYIEPTRRRLEEELKTLLVAVVLSKL